jgi:protein-disulfide isomerase
MLVDKVQYLQNGGGYQAPAGQQAAAGQQQQPPAKKFDNSTGPYPVLGNKNAKVTVVEFADFQCPFCEKWFTDVYPSIKKDYIDTGKVKFAFRDYAFLGQESTFAAEAAQCANEQGKFWEWHDYLYTHQGSENSGAFAKDKLEGFAADLGFNTQQFNQCLESDKYASAVSGETQKGSDFGVSGTPGTFVNNNLIVGAQPYDAFKTAIDQALAGK